MTGFGKSQLQLPTKNISIEIKSLNSKSLDLNARMPAQYREKELQMRQLIAKELVRGKVDFSMHVEITGEETSAKINASVVKAYIKELRNVVMVGSDENAKLLEIALSLPDAVSTDKTDIEESEFNQIMDALTEALQRINEFR